MSIVILVQRSRLLHKAGKQADTPDRPDSSKSSPIPVWAAKVSYRSELSDIPYRAYKPVRVKCLPTDTVGDLKKLIAAQTGTTAQKIQLKKWYVTFCAGCRLLSQSAMGISEAGLTPHPFTHGLLSHRLIVQVHQFQGSRHATRLRNQRWYGELPRSLSDEHVKIRAADYCRAWRCTSFLRQYALCHTTIRQGMQDQLGYPLSRS